MYTDTTTTQQQQVEGRRVAEVLNLRQRTRTRRQARASAVHEHRQNKHRRVAKVLKLSASEASGIFCDLYRYFKTHP